MALCCYYNLDIMSTQVDWIYKIYKQLVQYDICSTRRLSMKGLADIIAALAPLYYGGIQHESYRLISVLYQSITSHQCKQTTWVKLQDSNRQDFYCFHRIHYWIHCNSPLGLKFLVDACSNDDLEATCLYNSLLNHLQCPLCQQQGFGKLPRWEHLLC